VDVSHSDNDLDNETQSETPINSAGTSGSNRKHRDGTGAESQHDEQSLTLMLEKMKANPSEHHHKWLGRSAMFRPDGEEEQLTALVAESKVQGTKASFKLVTSDGRAHWVDTISAAGAILHRILFDEEAQRNGLQPRKVAMDLLAGGNASEGAAGGGAAGGGATIPDIRAHLKALSQKGHARLEEFIAEADSAFWGRETDRSVATSIYSMQHGLTLQQIMFALNQPPTSSKIHTITQSVAFKGHAETVVTALKRSHNLDTTVLKVLQVAFGSDLVPQELNFLIASKHVHSESESDEDDDFSDAP
jgi:hypothetical protein